LATVVNAVAVLIGSLIGMLIGGGIPQRYRKILFYAVGLASVGIGIQMVIKTNNPLIVLGSMAVGGLAGELMQIEERMHTLAERFKGEDFATGFVASSLLFLVGPMTIVGSITAGLTGDGSLIYMKSLMDGISSMVLASVYGIGVMASALSVLIVQGALVLGASSLSFLTSPAYLNDLVGVGGLMVIAIGLKILEIKDLKVGNFLPALIVEPIIVWLVSLI